MSNESTQPLIIERTYDAPAARVWAALTNADEMRHWYFDLKEFRAEPGFEFEFTVEHEGTVYRHLCRVTEVVAGRKLSYTWRYHGLPGDSLVTVELFAEGARTRVKLTHTGLETFPALPAYARRNFEQGWTQIMGTSLKDYVEKAK